MKIINDKLLASYRVRGKCAWCGKVVNLCAAHCFSRGAGRIDHSLNLLPMGFDAVLDCACHHDSHWNGFPGKSEMLALIAARENCRQDEIEAALMIVRHLPKAPRKADVLDGLVRFSANGGVATLVFRIIDESGVELSE